MKKLMIAAFAVAFAAVAQAAAVAWTSDTSYLVDSTGTKITALDSGSIVLVVLADQTGWSDGTWSAVAGSLTELQTGTIVDTGKASAKGKVNMTYTFDYGEQAFDNGDTLAAVFKADDGSYSQIAYYDGTAVTDTLTISGLDNDLYRGTLAFATSGNFMQPETIPEPTSALMLLVGLAGLALKRKIA